MNVLVIDDDAELVELLRFALGRMGMRVTGITDPLKAVDAVLSESPDVVVLDVNLGGWSGFDLLGEIRQRVQVPVLMLTGLGAEADKVRGLTLGADDYLTKPFGYRELAARLRAITRRRPAAPAEPSGPLRAGPLELDDRTHTVRKRGEPVSVTVNEFRFLKRLMQEPGVVVPTNVLLQHVWGYAPDEHGGDVVRVLVHRLRRKIEDDPSAPALLRTVPGVGVRLAVPQEGETA